MIVDPDPTIPITQNQWAQINTAWPNPERLRIAFRLALDLNTCRLLLSDLPVDPAHLDRQALDHARSWQLVRFDRTMLDVYADTLASITNTSLEAA